MSCPRVLHAFGGHSQPVVTPVDLAMCLSLSRRQSLYQLVSPPAPNATQHKPNEGLHSLFSPLAPPSNVPLRPRSCFRRIGLGLSKKRVMFADTKGLALAAVHVFTPESASFDSPLMKTPADTHVLHTLPQDQQSTSNKQQHYRLRVGLAQPFLDFKAYLAHQEMPIQLESCDISENSLIGKVCVSHDNVKKTVWIRLTFDSWRSYRDFPCMFLLQQPPAVDVYAFDLCLPKNIDPKQRAEFFVFCTAGPGSTPQWDNNRGNNYSVHLDKDGSHVRQSQVNLWRRTSLKQRPPLWPSSELQNLYI
eukprot:XP_011615905.1 PREDICTED: protein phosphatase 1 regulatory subunit 3C-B-like [Takifugu rubripes]